MKYCDPQYQEYTADKIPEFKNDQIHAKVIAGEVFGVKGPVTTRTPAYYIDLTIQSGTTYEHVIPQGWNSMIVCHAGELTVQDADDKKIGAATAVVFKINKNSDEKIKFKVLKNNTRFIMLAGLPLNEPIAAQGPFVLNEKAELYQAFDDYQSGKNGFENAPNWSSEIRNLAHKSRTK